MNKQNQWLFEAPLAPEATHDTNLYTNPEYYNPEWELPEGSNDGSLVGEEENNYWPSHPYTALEFEAEWELSGRKSSKKSGKASWLQTLLPLLNRYRGGIPLDFLLGWIDIESGGRIGVVTNLDERGYFQIHPGESKNPSLRFDHRRLSTDPDYFLKSGIQLITYYGTIVQKNYKLQYGTDLFWHIVKLLHWLPGGVQVIFKDMGERGVAPKTWEELKQYVIANRERIRQRIKREYRHSWDPMQGITNVDKLFERGRQLAMGLTMQPIVPIAPTQVTSFKQRVKEIAEQEWEFFGRGEKTQHDPSFWQRVNFSQFSFSPI